MWPGSLRWNGWASQNQKIYTATEWKMFTTGSRKVRISVFIYPRELNITCLENQIMLSRQMRSCIKQVLLDFIWNKPWRLQNTHSLCHKDQAFDYSPCADALEELPSGCWRDCYPAPCGTTTPWLSAKPPLHTTTMQHQWLTHAACAQPACVAKAEIWITV